MQNHGIKHSLNDDTVCRKEPATLDLVIIEAYSMMFSFTTIEARNLHALSATFAINLELCQMFLLTISRNIEVHQGIQQ